MAKPNTKDIFVIFVIAKVLSLVTALFIFGTDGNSDYISLVAHTASLTIFIVALLLMMKRSVSKISVDTRVQGRKWGHPIIWIVLSIPLGFLVRFGVEGVYLLIVNIYDNQLVVNAFNDLVASNRSDGMVIAWLSAAVVLVGALDEEFIYRKIFLWHFCQRYGVITGIAVASFIFGVAHWNPVTFIAAICLACIYLASGRLWVVVVVHAAGNMFHPLMGSMIASTTWDVYFKTSVLGVIMLLLVMVCVSFAISRKMPVYDRLFLKMAEGHSGGDGSGSFTKAGSDLLTLGRWFGKNGVKEWGQVHLRSRRIRFTYRCGAGITCRKRKRAAPE